MYMSFEAKTGNLNFVIPNQVSPGTRRTRSFAVHAHPYPWFVRLSEDSLSFNLVAPPEDAPRSEQSFRIMATSLAPHREANARFLDFEPSSLAVVLKVGNGIEVFGPASSTATAIGLKQSGKPTLSRSDSVFNDTLSAKLDQEGHRFWSAAHFGDEIWTYVGRQSDIATLHRYLFDGEHVERKRFRVRVPKVEGETAGVVAFAIHPPTDTIYLLWEGTETFYQRDHQTSRDLMVAAYMVPDPAFASGEVELDLVRKFRLKHHPINGVRHCRVFLISPSGRTLVYATQQVGAGYDAQTGKPKYILGSGHTFAASPGKQLLAVGSHRESLAPIVYDVETGRPVFRVSKSGKVETMAISPDSERLYVGWQNHVLEIFGIHQQVSLRTIDSDVSPVMILQRRDRYVGFRRKSGELGDHVIADCSSGRPIITLCQNSHFLNQISSNHNASIVSRIGKEEVDLFRSTSVSRARERLSNFDDKACARMFQLAIDQANNRKRRTEDPSKQSEANLGY